jgi:hypothetical protein
LPGTVGASERSDERTWIAIRVALLRCNPMVPHARSLQSAFQAGSTSTLWIERTYNITVRLFEPSKDVQHFNLSSSKHVTLDIHGLHEQLTELPLASH